MIIIIIQKHFVSGDSIQQPVLAFSSEKKNNPLSLSLPPEWRSPIGPSATSQCFSSSSSHWFSLLLPPLPFQVPHIHNYRDIVIIFSPASSSSLFLSLKLSLFFILQRMSLNRRLQSVGASYKRKKVLLSFSDFFFFFAEFVIFNWRPASVRVCKLFSYYLFCLYKILPIVLLPSRGCVEFEVTCCRFLLVWLLFDSLEPTSVLRRFRFCHDWREMMKLNINIKLILSGWIEWFISFIFVLDWSTHPWFRPD